MFALAFIAVYAAAAQVVPIAGRPVDFSGAVGGPFLVIAKLDCSDANVGEPILFKFRIIGPGDFSRLRRPQLDRDPEFAKRFVIEDGPRRIIADPPGVEFEYTLQPKYAFVDVSLRLKFVYFNPKIVPKSNGFQTTYSEPKKLSAWEIPAQPVLSAELQNWAHGNFPWPEPSQQSSAFRDYIDEWLVRLGFTSNRTNRQRIWGVFWFFPPVICVIWYVIWHRHRPSRFETRLDFGDSTEKLAATFHRFLMDKYALPAGAITPLEVGQALALREISENKVQAVEAWLRDLDAVRYSSSSRDVNLLSRARSLAYDLESTP